MFCNGEVLLSNSAFLPLVVLPVNYKKKHKRNILLSLASKRKYTIKVSFAFDVYLDEKYIDQYHI